MQNVVVKGAKKTKHQPSISLKDLHTLTLLGRAGGYGCLKWSAIRIKISNVSQTLFAPLLADTFPLWFPEILGDSWALHSRSETKTRTRNHVNFVFKTKLGMYMQISSEIMFNVSTSRIYFNAFNITCGGG